MPLTREDMLEKCITDYFIGLNNKDVPLATSMMAEECVMRFSAAKYRYEGKGANITHLTDFTQNFEIIDFRDFVNIVDVDQQLIAVTFQVDLTDDEGEVLSMNNSNIFRFNAEGLCDDILIFNGAPLKKGFEVGSAV